MTGAEGAAANALAVGADGVLGPPTVGAASRMRPRRPRRSPGRSGPGVGEPGPSAPSCPLRVQAGVRLPATRPIRRIGPYRNQTRPTSASIGTGPYRRESTGWPAPAASRSGSVASDRSHAESAASTMWPSSSSTRSPGPAATRLIASRSESGSRKTTIASGAASGRWSGRRGASRRARSSAPSTPRARRRATGPGRAPPDPRRGPRARTRRGPAAGRGLGSVIRLGRLVRRDVSGGPAVDPGLAFAAGRLPGRVDLVDHVEELLRVGEVGRSLDLADCLVAFQNSSWRFGTFSRCSGLK